jgi:hypothetical protein
MVVALLTVRIKKSPLVMTLNKPFKLLSLKNKGDKEDNAPKKSITVTF